MIKLGILGSTRGTASQGIIDAIKSKQLDASIEIVVSNKQDAYILERAEKHSIKTEFIDPKGLSRENYDRKLTETFKQHQVDIILLIGYMKILSDEFVQTWEHKLLNVHPSLLPKHGGLMDLAVHQAVLDAGDSETGCTIHFVNEIVDGGEIVLQKRCKVEASDTAETLKAKVQALESEAFVEAVKSSRSS